MAFAGFATEQQYRRRRERLLSIAKSDKNAWFDDRLDFGGKALFKTAFPLILAWVDEPAPVLIRVLVASVSILIGYNEWKLRNTTQPLIEVVPASFHERHDDAFEEKLG